MPEEKRRSCKLVMCVDPVTGRVTVRPEGQCPDGYIEEVHRKVTDDGFTFIKPKAKIEEE